MNLEQKTLLKPQTKIGPQLLLPDLNELKVSKAINQQLVSLTMGRNSRCAVDPRAGWI